MCDYSLHSIRNRLAVEGEPLQVHRFPTGSLGLASPADLEPRVKEPSAHTRSGWWSAVKRWLSADIEQPVPAVCVPPGSRLILREVPQPLRQKLGVGAEEEVTFVQLDAATHSYRDAVRFNNGRELLIQHLPVGQQLDVLCLSTSDEEHQRVPAKAAPGVAASRSSI